MPVFGRLLKSCRDALMTPAEDPRRRWESTVQRQQWLIEQVRLSNARVAETTARVDQRLLTLRMLDPALDEQARLAVSAGNDDLARAILRRQQQALAEHTFLEGHLRDLRRQAQRLTIAEHQLAAKMDAWIVRREVIEARVSAAQVRAGVGLIEGLPDIDDALDHLDARAAALDELTDVGVLGLTQLKIDAAEIETRLDGIRAATRLVE